MSAARDNRTLIKPGIDDQYEPPLSPELVLDTITHSAEDNAGRIVRYLVEHELIPREASPVISGERYIAAA